LEVSITRKPLQVAVINGSCADVIDATYADLSVRPTPDSQPFLALMRYQLVLDGVEVSPFSPSLWAGEGPHQTIDMARALGVAETRVYAVCQLPGPYVEPESATSLGHHRAKVRGTLPDGTVHETEEVAFELRCDGPGPAAGWEDIGSEGFDRPTPTGAGTGAADGGAGRTGELTGDEASRSGGSGCTISLANTRPPFGIALPVAAALLLVGRRRRRHPR
jgi:hypothetical protein